MRFEDFAAARLPALLRYAMLLSGDREAAHDLVQESLAKALVKWDRIAGMDEPHAYVRRILTNEFLSQRRRRRFREVPFDPRHDHPAPPTAAPSDGDELWQLLATLPGQQRAVLVLRYYEGLADPEIGEALGCRAATVRGYASRALATLRIQLSEVQEVRS